MRSNRGKAVTMKEGARLPAAAQAPEEDVCDMGCMAVGKAYKAWRGKNTHARTHTRTHTHTCTHTYTHLLDHIRLEFACQVVFKGVKACQIARAPVPGDLDHVGGRIIQLHSIRCIIQQRILIHIIELAHRRAPAPGDLRHNLTGGPLQWATSTILVMLYEAARHQAHHK
eukprot:902012-Pelagomonas_calceolata.AAC.6